jgi:phosphonate transport system permease protein
MNMSRVHFGLGAWAAALISSMILIQLNPFTIPLTFQQLRNFVGRAFPPDFSEWQLILELVAQSFVIALLGTGIGLMLSLPIAVISAKSTKAPGPFRFVAKAIVISTRAVPGLVFAILFVEILGPGSTAGVLALALNSIGMMGRLFADAIDNLDKSASNALNSSGATRMQSFFAATVPQFMPALIATTLHRLDINFRYSTILGLVGAGGIGLYLSYNINYFDYQDAMAAVIAIVITVFLIEAISTKLRTRALTLRSVTSNGVRKLFFRVALVVSLISAVWNAGSIEVERFSSIPSGTWDLLLKMTPPDFQTYPDQIINGAIQSISMAIIATTFGAALAVPLGFLAAKNVANRLTVIFARGIGQTVRGIPDLVLALFFIVLIGLGPVTGAITLTIGTVGFLTKFVADSVEELNMDARDALLASGTTKFQAFVAATLPALRPALISHMFYSLDLNFRLSALMGVVGAGGIGAVISQSIYAGYYKTGAAAILVVFTGVLTIDFLSKKIMNRYNKA